MRATFLKYLLHLKSLKFLVLLILGATTTVMLHSGNERFNPAAAIRLNGSTWAAETWRLINVNVGKKWEGNDGTQQEKTASDNKDNNVQGNKEPTTHVLLVSSMGRSGSSFLGQMLSSVPSAFYYFEPLYRMSYQLQEGMVWRGLMGLFTCNISRKFLNAVVDR
ncbi:hypothetical protein Pmani_006635 [Petrolisthes manimaculis]|uniref:Sulfotransferase n=1 Tax=Petrolisthes manimaculis TaxID=1843537 RepID=A0AAE1QA07_9EUCA|nr:hypothetical protein Pmani_006635 [Petrolisthes manimaculis]